MTNSLVLDDLDKRILLQLQQNSAITNQELAEKVHASAPTCLRRVRRLTEDGWIQRQVALVQPEKLGMTLTAIVEITLDVQTSEQLAFEQLVAGEPAIQQCYRVSPGPDFVLVLLVQDMPTMRWRIVCFPASAISGMCAVSFPSTAANSIQQSLYLNPCLPAAVFVSAWFAAALSTSGL
jgi:Lrp/AsnC family leucine-responsive transcriptional regulator